MAKENLTNSAAIQVRAREIDFVTRFQRTWEHLREILGIMRPIKKEPGAVLKSLYAEGVLQPGSVGEGEVIPYSKYEVKEKYYDEMTIEKYSKAVSIEAINKHGYEVAVQMTDDEFLFQLQTNVTDRFYAYLNTGLLTVSANGFQHALAMAKGCVENKFKEMKRQVTGVVGFVNLMDMYEYLGNANVTVQTAFGFTYIKDFLGFQTIILLSDSEIPRGRVIATPINNICLYYVDPASSSFARAGLVYATQGETNLIGFHTQGNYSTAVSEAFALMGLTLFAEYQDGIAVVTIDESPTLGTLTVTSAAGTASGTTKLTVSPDREASGNVYKYKAGTAETAVVYGQNVRNWTTWDGESDLTIATGQKVTVVECDANYTAQNAGTATVTAKA